MNRFQYLLTKLAEEASEVSQIALKTQQFGASETMPGQNWTNVQRIHQELNDMLAIVGMLNSEYGFGFYQNEQQIQAKEEKVEKFFQYSKSLGQVTVEPR